MTFKYLSEIAVAVDVLLLMAVLQLIVFDIEPESLHDAGTSLCVHSQQSGQTGIDPVCTEGAKEKYKVSTAIHVPLIICSMTEGCMVAVSIY